jgi:hypothetical protein
MTKGAPPRTSDYAAPVWAEGYIARARKVERGTNPYVADGDFREDLWDDGWLFADAEIVRDRRGRVTKVPTR